MGRKKLRNPKTRNSYSLEHAEKLHELRDKLAPKGLHLTDSQAIDVAIVVLHEIMFDENLLGARRVLDLVWPSAEQLAAAK